MIQKFNILFVLFFAFVYADEWVNKTSDFERNESTVLSRRKRFIVFPEGSSFQVGKQIYNTF